MEQKQQFTMERLDDIVHSAQKARKTGLLLVKINEGGTVLEGEITFVVGHITWASVGPLSGTEAIKWLSTFGHKCACMFVPATDAQMSGPITSSSGNLHSHTSAQRINSGQLRHLLLSNGSSGVRTNPRAPSTSEIAIPHALRPHNEVLPLIERAGLSRAHRHLFLLIDGNRSITDLQHLMGRSPTEVNSLLRDLERVSAVAVKTTF